MDNLIFAVFSRFRWQLFICLCWFGILVWSCTHVVLFTILKIDFTNFARGGCFQCDGREFLSYSNCCFYVDPKSSGSPTFLLLRKERIQFLWGLLHKKGWADEVVIAGSGKADRASFGQPVGICVELEKNIFICDTQTGSVKLLTSINGMEQFLRHIGPLCRFIQGFFSPP